MRLMAQFTHFGELSLTEIEQPASGPTAHLRGSWTARPPYMGLASMARWNAVSHTSNQSGENQVSALIEAIAIPSVLSSFPVTTLDSPFG